MKTTLFLKNGLLGLAAAAMLLTANAAAKADAAVYQRTLLSTAWVWSPIDEKNSSTGTGACVDSQRRLIVTNFHVVGDRKDAFVYFPSFQDGEAVALRSFYESNKARLAVKGKVLVADSKRDLAVIQLDRLPAGVRPIALASRSVSPGANIHGIGNSDSNNGTLWRYNNGPVRGVFPKRITSGNANIKQFTIEAKVIESQMATNPGDSGGPIVNDGGELVGIHHGNANGQLLVSFAIDVSEVRKVLSDVVNGKTAAKDEEEIAARPADEDKQPLRGIGQPKEKEKEQVEAPKPLPEPKQVAEKTAPKLDRELPAPKPVADLPAPEPAEKKSIFGDAKPVVDRAKPVAEGTNPVVKPVVKPVIKPSQCDTPYCYTKRSCH